METKTGLGYQNYEEVIANNIFYIDKTDFIKEWWENADKVTLITRPRRFGKTLNMSTVECFFSNQYADRSDLFEGKNIWKYEQYRQLQGIFPVIFLSFANVYTLMLTNFEVKRMFRNMVKGWFGGSAETAYNNFVKALLLNDVDAMNEFMNKVALHSFSSFDTAKNVSDDDAPERFYHGFVLGLMVELGDRFRITSNRESGFGRYDVMLVPTDQDKDNAYIIEFKVHKPKREKDLEETLENAHVQIEEKKYEAKLISEGFLPEQIRKYGFAFKGKECLIG